MSETATSPPPNVPEEQRTRLLIDASCRRTVLAYYASAVVWLVAGSLFAMFASIKLHTPGFFTGTEWLTFGRVRPAHLNLMIYGWASMAGIGTGLWLQARLCRVPLPWPRLLPLTSMLWNIAMAAGVAAILSGQTTGVEWLEFPPPVLWLFGFVLVVLFAATLKIFRARRVYHTYVSQWYLFGAFLWFPVLYAIAILLDQSDLVAGGAPRGAINWWYAHNVLGLWLTPIGLAAAYYLIPKVIGKPVHSYHLSLLGFWTLALFYNWAGTHHLIGGPLPAWVITVGIIGSMMMFIPVITVAINHHLTLVGSFRVLRTSPTLRFIVFGAMSYTMVSFQGSLQALRSINEVTHFTHYTVAHAHLGVYAFATMILFGAYYYIVPRLTRKEWSSARLIKVHFWTAASGIAAYWIALTLGGWNQGLLMNDPNVPFLEIVRYTQPYLAARSIAGVLLTIGHLAFGLLLWRILRTREPAAAGPTLFTTTPAQEA